MITKKRAIPLQFQLLFGIGLMGALIMIVAAVVVSYRESRMLTELTLEKHFLLTHSFTRLAAEHLHHADWEQLQEYVLTPLGNHAEVVYTFLMDIDGTIRASTNAQTVNTTLPRIVAPRIDPGALLQTRRIDAGYSTRGGVFRIQETPLLQDVSYQGTLRGRQGEIVYDTHQELYVDKRLVGTLRVGFSRTFLQEQLDQTRYTILVIGILFLGSIILLGLVISRYLSTPLRRLTAEVAKLGGGNSFFKDAMILYGASGFSPVNQLEQIQVENIATNTLELRALRDAFVHMKSYLIGGWQALQEQHQEIEKLNFGLEKLVAERTKELNAALEDLRDKDQVMQSELDVASDIQRGILPSISWRRNGINIVAYYQPMTKVGGDMYDIFQMRGGRLGILMADVSGHGIPAALITVMAKLSFTEAARRFVSPREILLHVNESLFRTITTMEYLTAFVVVISPSYEVAYGKASHRTALVLRKHSGQVEEWDAKGVFLGTFSTQDIADRYEEQNDHLDYGDRLLLYTDGLVEARNPAGEQWGEAPLLSILQETAELPLQEVKQRILATWEYFKGGAPLDDDVTFLILEIDPLFQQLLEYRERGRRFLIEQKIEEALHELGCALELDKHEALVNQLIGKCYFIQERFAEAILHLKTYLEQHPDDADGLLMLAVAAYREKEFTTAIRSAQSACQLRPQFKSALEIWGQALKATLQFHEAQAVWAQLLVLDPQHEMALTELRHALAIQSSRE